MTTTPEHLKDGKDRLNNKGFSISNCWYHGTSSALVDAIQKQGLKQSGDQALKAAAAKTMATIGNEYEESVEPVFLTPSKQLAYYWALQTVRERQVRLGQTEQGGSDEPAVFAVTLPDELNTQVKPDVGAASLLLLKEGENYMAYLAGMYQEQELGIPEIDLMNADRWEYLHTLGMAYFDGDIDADYLKLVTC